MVKIPEVYVVGKGTEWLMSSRPDILQIPHAHIFSRSIYDAKKMDLLKDAKRLAKKVGGEVWKFIPATGKKEKIDFRALPAGAKCDNCRTWTPYNGVCRNPESEYYHTAVSMKDVCDEWEAKEDGGEEREADRSTDKGRGQMEKQGP